MERGLRILISIYPGIIMPGFFIDRQPALIYTFFVSNETNDEVLYEKNI